MITDGYRSNATRWVDRILSAHWDRLEKKVGPDMMPRLAGGRGKRVVIEEYGCGHYGCVAPTGARDLVFKLTSDGTEAAFVAQALKLGSWPEGIVRYAGIYRLPDESHRRRSVYVLWREEAEKIGELGAFAKSADDLREQKRAAQRLWQFKLWAGDARWSIHRSKHPSKLLVEAKGLEEWARGAVDYQEVEDYGFSAYRNTESPMPRSLTGARALAYELRACDILSELMENEPGGYLIGGALQFYLGHDILLADVHLQNVGLVEREDYASGIWVITDPGHMAPLSPARMDFVVEDLT